MFRRGLVLPIIGFGLAAAVGAADRGPAGERAPTVRPEIRLERAIDNPSLSRRGAGRKLLKWVTGRPSGRDEVLRRPYGVTWASGALVVTDPGAARVVRVDPRGRIAMSAPGDFVSPIGVAACAAGLVVTDSRSGKVALLDSRLRVRDWLAEDLRRPTGVACDGPRIYVLETGRHRVLVLGAAAEGSDSKGHSTVLASWGRRGDGAAEFNFPTSIALDGDSVWVGDTLNFRIQRLDAELGTHVDEFGQLGDAPGQMPRIKGLAVDREGNLWVSDAHLDEIAIYDQNGVFLTHLGAATDSSEALLSFPAGVAAHPDGRVAVVDSLHRRILVFRVSWPAKGRAS